MTLGAWVSGGFTSSKEPMSQAGVESASPSWGLLTPRWSVAGGGQAIGSPSVGAQGVEFGVAHLRPISRLVEGSRGVAVPDEVVASRGEGVGGSVEEVHVGVGAGGDDRGEHIGAGGVAPLAAHAASLSARGGVIGYGGELYDGQAKAIVDARAHCGSSVAAYGGVGDGECLAVLEVVSVGIDPAAEVG